MAKTVMVADDEERLLELVVATLEGDERYRVLQASDGEQALAIARQEHPDLVFLDVMMPKLNGYEVCRALKEDPTTAHARVVMLTALGQEKDRRLAREAGADDYFTKPFSPMALLMKVDQILFHRQDER
ncbi:MAG: response regulator [Chloroflexi bacterium]|nr:response regulator [Chloroflexota bacterium]